MAFWLTAPRHYLNQRWLRINEDVWHSTKTYFTASAQVTIWYNRFENYTFKIITTSPSAQCVEIIHRRKQTSSIASLIRIKIRDIDSSSLEMLNIAHLTAFNISWDEFNQSACQRDFFCWGHRTYLDKSHSKCNKSYYNKVVFEYQHQRHDTSLRMNSVGSVYLLKKTHHLLLDQICVPIQYR